MCDATKSQHCSSDSRPPVSVQSWRNMTSVTHTNTHTHTHTHTHTEGQHTHTHTPQTEGQHTHTDTHSSGNRGVRTAKCQPGTKVRKIVGMIAAEAKMWALQMHNNTRKGYDTATHLQEKIRKNRLKRGSQPLRMAEI